MARFYGSIFETETMPLERLIEYFDCIDIIKARESLDALSVETYQMKSKKQRKAFLKELRKRARVKEKIIEVKTAAELLKYL